jgi:ribose 5-phosphate isomerase A
VINELKAIVGRYAFKLFSKFLEEASVIGLGTGSTIRYLIDELISNNMLRGKVVVVSSYDTLYYISKFGIKGYTPLTYNGVIDVYLDGFDEASLKMDLIKGRGAALVWEKKLASMSKTRIYVGDYTKMNNREYLYMKPLPIEVSRDKINNVINSLEKLGFTPIIRMGVRKDGPVISDNGGLIVDIIYDKIVNAEEIDNLLRSVDGVIDTGLFPARLVDYIVSSYPGGIVKVFSRSGVLF